MANVQNPYPFRHYMRVKGKLFTLTNWGRAVAQEMEPLYRQLENEFLNQVQREKI